MQGKRKSCECLTKLCLVNFKVIKKENMQNYNFSYALYKTNAE